MLPVALLHGIFGFDRLKIGPFTLNYFGSIERTIGERGHPVLVTRVPFTGPVCQRAQRLKECIEKWLGEIGRDRVILVAHSMGGLDARYMISALGMAERVAALLTIATPHRGSPLADFWMTCPPMQRVGLPLLEKLGIDTRGGGDLTTAAARQFNEAVPDSPRVRYFSITTACPPNRVPLPLQFGYHIVRKHEGENDSMVSVQSALWGEHLATWPVHHLHAINRRFPADIQSPIGDVAPMYLEALEKVESAVRG